MQEVLTYSMCKIYVHATYSVMACTTEIQQKINIYNVTYYVKIQNFW